MAANVDLAPKVDTVIEGSSLSLRQLRVQRTSRTLSTEELYLLKLLFATYRSRRLFVVHMEVEKTFRCSTLSTIAMFNFLSLPMEACYEYGI